MASITKRNTSTLNGNNNLASSQIVPIPSGTSNGDIIIAIAQSYVNPGPGITGQTMTRLGDIISNGMYYSSFYKIHSTGDPTGITFTVSGTAKGKITMVSYYGDYNITNPIQAFSNTGYITSNTALLATGLTSLQINTPLIFHGGIYATTSRSFTVPTSPGTFIEDFDGGSTAPDMWHYFASYMYGGGNTGNVSAVISANNTIKHAFMVALNPPAPVLSSRQRIRITHQ